MNGQQTSQQMADKLQEAFQVGLFKYKPHSFRCSCAFVQKLKSSCLLLHSRMVRYHRHYSLQSPSLSHAHCLRSTPQLPEAPRPPSGAMHMYTRTNAGRRSGSTRPRSSGRSRAGCRRGRSRRSRRNWRGRRYGPSWSKTDWRGWRTSSAETRSGWPGGRAGGGARQAVR